MESIPVQLNGRRLIWLKRDDRSGPLAYPEWMEGRANLFVGFYAQMTEGIIKRDGEVIGTMDDLVFPESSLPD